MFNRKFNWNQIKRFYQTMISPENSKNEIKTIIEKINLLPIKIDTNHLDIDTLNRLNKCSTSFLIDLIQNLNKYGIKDKYLSNTLKTYDDWSLLTHDKLSSIWNTFRELSFKSDIYLTALSTNSQIIYLDKRSLELRLKDLKKFFTNKHLDRILVKSPGLLTNNFDQFRYKFTYIFSHMGIEQDQMSSSYAFNQSIDHIRQRHLFLVRSAFYDKPNKKGETKIENPKLSIIVDTNLKEYLRLCTQNVFNITDYETFCDYLQQENFDNELLGLRIEKTLRNQIFDSIKQQKQIDYLNSDD